jgi:penicillin-binding protein A
MPRRSKRRLSPTLILLASGAGALALAAGAPAKGIPAASASVAGLGKPTGLDPQSPIDFDRRVRVGDLFYAPRAEGGQAVLTIDPSAQARAESVLEKADAPYGSIVVMDLDGRVLALAGRAAEDPSMGAALAVRPWAPSASVFKVVTAAALLSEGRDERVCVHGGIRGVAPDDLVDDARRDSFCGDLGVALAKSQNAMIGKLAARYLSSDELTAFAERFGYNKVVRFPIATTPSTATMPDDKLERARAAAGFWHSDLSPLAAAQLISVVANQGKRVTPRLVAGIVDEAGFHAPPIVPPAQAIEPAVAARLAQMLVATTETGTAKNGFTGPKGRLLPYRVAGKTGSLARKGDEPLDYSWFVGFAPADRPRVVVAVLLGNGPAYRLKAHTAARLVLEKVLE